MPRTINAKTRITSVRDYVTSGDSLRTVSKRNGISSETLRRFLGDKVRKNSNNNLVTSGREVIAALPIKKKRAAKNGSFPNSNLRWTSEEDELLREAVLNDFTVKETVQLIGRTNAAIMCRKHDLMENGFIENIRFKNPEKIVPSRRSKNLVLESPVISNQNVSNDVDDKIISHNPLVQNSEPIEGPSLRELAEIVKDFGVNINMTVTSGGTVIKIHN
jgi:hypothetical protein